MYDFLRLFYVIGGDILSGNGEGSTSIYGTYFEDENLTINHTARGFIGMANEGPDRWDLLVLALLMLIDT